MAVRTVDVAFLYEHVCREIDVACAVTAALRSDYGLQVEILQYPLGFLREVAHLRPALVVLPYCYKQSNWDRLAGFWPRAILFNLAWEQLFSPGNLKTKTPGGQRACRQVVHHAWSDSYRSFLIENGVPSSHIFLNGQPAYYLYSEPYRRCFPSRSELSRQHRLDSGRRWVFFPENYHWAFQTDETLDARVAIDGLSRDDLHEMRTYCARSLADAIRWLADVARTEDVEVIVRPRPGTAPSRIRDAVDRVLPHPPPHLHIIEEHSVREWILASDVVMSSHSSSLIEAAVAGKPAFMVEPHPMPRALATEWHSLTPRLTSSDELVWACCHAHRPADDRLAAWARDTMMSNGDAIAHLARFIARLLEHKEEALRGNPRKFVAVDDAWVPPAALWSLYHRTRRYARYRKTNGIGPASVNDMMSSRAIEMKVTEWAQLTGQRVTPPSSAARS